MGTKGEQGSETGRARQKGGCPIGVTPAGVPLSSATLEVLGPLLAELGMGASLVDRDLRLVWGNGLVRPSAAKEDATSSEAQPSELHPCRRQGGERSEPSRPRAGARRRTTMTRAAGRLDVLDDPAAADHCYAMLWCRGSRCSDCLPLLVFQTGEAHEGFRERRRPHEAPRMYSVVATPIRDAAGALTHVLETFVDVTNLSRHVGQLELSSQLSSSLSAAGHGLFVIDPLGRIVSWSSAMTAILGYPVDEILGRHVRMLAADPASERIVDSLSRGRAEVRLKARDGRLVPVAVSTTSIQDEHGGLCGYQALVEDLSEVAKLRKEVQLGERALAEILRASADAIFSTDSLGRIRAWNRGAASALGYEAAEAVRLTLGDLLGRDAADALLRRARAVSTVRDYRQVVRHRSGASVVLELTVTTLRDADDRLTGFSLIGRDVSARDRLQQQMIRSEKLAAVGSLAAGLAHEIGTPLNVISAATEYVLLDLAADDPRRTELGTVLGETERIRRLVSDLLGFARGTAPTIGETQPEAAVERVLRLLGVETKKRGVRVTVTAAPGLPDVAIETDALHQVLLNVILNATAAVRDGGRIDVSLRPEVLRLPGGERPAVCFAIADDGPGVPPELRQRVFDPFFTTRPDGTGLGLTVCNRIVTDHGGVIDLAEAPTGGALVEITLPTVETQEPAG